MSDRIIFIGGFSATLSPDHKEFKVQGHKFDLPLTIDFDDVDHEKVERDIITLLQILMIHWPMPPDVPAHCH